MSKRAHNDTVIELVFHDLGDVHHDAITTQPNEDCDVDSSHSTNAYKQLPGSR